ncbi:integral membrane protein [Aspergillus uvarum CBS 121591]|uniref:Integral membrane protein n=1 Tax=Aspergillus uvarum CBS 121591 TaxID=1448315 RepID=A0A319CB40_9EURO|nr:integral membrane protein [Aspergillus uvarum CBS 121591]PYH82444.1 integral membrane protein [Aspergillus uvarum CBS 121591]
MTWEENRYWKNALTIVPIVGAAFATVTYALRLYSRRYTTAGLKLEDLLMGVGLILSYCATAFVVDTAFNGVGISVSSLPPKERRRIQFGSWMIQKFWAPSAAFIKISIIVFLRRLLGTLRTYTLISNGLIIFIAGWAVTALLVNIFQCIPVQYYYDKTLNGHCMAGQRAFFQAMGSIALVEDVIILLLPAPVVWGLQITIRQKIALTMVFSLGGLVCIFSLMRLIEFRKFITTDLASSSAKESLWTCLELDIAIICGCLPLLKPLLQGFLGKVKSGVSKGRSHPSSGTKLYGYQTSNTHHDGFLQINDLHGSQLSKGANVAAGASRNSSDVELQGIAVHTVIEQDVDDHPQLSSSETVSNHGWPR